MDVEMGLIMRNMIQARPGLPGSAYGTGLLINAAHFGAFTMGSDIDIRVIKARRTTHGAERRRWTNFETTAWNPPWVCCYGPAQAQLTAEQQRGRCRASSGTLRTACARAVEERRAEARDDGAVARSRGAQENYIPSTAPHPFSECMDDLMDTLAAAAWAAGCVLHPGRGGPEDAAAAGVDSVPSHPALKLRASSVQLLSEVGRGWDVESQTVRRYRESGAETLRERVRRKGAWRTC